MLCMYMVFLFFSCLFWLRARASNFGKFWTRNKQFILSGLTTKYYFPFGLYTFTSILFISIFLFIRTTTNCVETQEVLLMLCFFSGQGGGLSAGGAVFFSFFLGGGIRTTTNCVETQGVLLMLCFSPIVSEKQRKNHI